jgi:hypothetical protein
LAKGIEQNSYAAQANQDGQPVELFDQVIASRTFADGIFAVLDSKNQGNATFGSRRVARSNNLPGLQASSSVVRGMQPSGIKSACCGGSPCGELGILDQDGESVFGYEVISSQPTNFDSSEWVMNLNTCLGENNLWVNNQNPEDCDSGKAVESGYVSFMGHSSEVVGTRGKSTNDNHQSKVSPVASRAVNVFVRHDGQTTTVDAKVSKDSFTKEGI